MIGSGSERPGKGRRMLFRLSVSEEGLHRGPLLNSNSPTPRALTLTRAAASSFCLPRPRRGQTQPTNGRSRLTPATLLSHYMPHLIYLIVNFATVLHIVFCTSFKERELHSLRACLVMVFAEKGELRSDFNWCSWIL